MAAKISPTDYDGLLKLCKREHHEYSIGHNTRARRNGSSIVIIYHNTVISTLERAESGSTFVMVRCGEWHTNTTKDRINQFLPLPWSLCQKDFSWFLQNRRDGRIIPFNEAAYFVNGDMQ